MQIEKIKELQARLSVLNWDSITISPLMVLLSSGKKYATVNVANEEVIVHLDGVKTYTSIDAAIMAIEKYLNVSPVIEIGVCNSCEVQYAEEPTYNEGYD